MSSHSYALRPRRPHQKRRITRPSDSESDSGSESDPDYQPHFAVDSDSDSGSDSESEYETDEDTESEYETDEDTESEDTESDTDAVASFTDLGRCYRLGDTDTSMADVPSRRIAKAKHNPKEKNKETDWYRKMSPEEKAFMKQLSPSEKAKLFESFGRLQSDASSHQAPPLRFKILDVPSTVLSDASKRLILQKLEHFQTMTEENTEYAKYSLWIRSMEQMPLGRYHTILANPDTDSIASVLHRTKEQLDSVVYGHTETKQQLLMLMAQWISNPTSKGQCIGIQGPMGIGKTTLIKDGVSKALGLPFGFIALGGASDAAFLEGHGFTYEGATFGRIAEILIKHQVMNPILFFDELDKISDSPKGEEISSLLTHLTDPTQNALFTDKYFGSVELDLSRCLMVFSFNDSSKIHPILKDRLSMIHLQGYTADEKINIAQSYILPKLFRQYNLPTDNEPAIVIRLPVLRAILSQTPEEKGIRQLIQSLERIFGWVNMARYIPVPPFETPIQLPFVVEESHLPVFLQKQRADGDTRPPFSMYS